MGYDIAFDDLVAEPSNDSSNAASEVDDAPVVRFLQKMLLDAFTMRALDLHFEPYEHTYRVRFRVDGELREIASPPIAIKEKRASRIKVISRPDISEKRVPQDGRMALRLAGAGRHRLALASGRSHVSFADLKRVATPSLRHRLIPSFEAEADAVSPDAIVERLLSEVPELPESVRRIEN